MERREKGKHQGQKIQIHSLLCHQVSQSLPAKDSINLPLRNQHWFFFFHHQHEELLVKCVCKIFQNNFQLGNISDIPKNAGRPEKCKLRTNFEVLRVCMTKNCMWLRVFPPSLTITA